MHMAWLNGEKDQSRVKACRDDVHWKDILAMTTGLRITPGEIISNVSISRTEFIGIYEFILFIDKYMIKMSINNNKPCVVCSLEKGGRIILGDGCAEKGCD